MAERFVLHHAQRLLSSLLSHLASIAILACSAQDPPPHLLLITSDTLRADHLSLNGYARQTSPHLDEFASEAWNFTQAVTIVPKTGPSMATHFTGLPPGAHRVTTNPSNLPAEIPLLAEILKAHAYATAAFVSNPVLAARKGYARGFDHYEHFPRDGEIADLNASFLRWAAEMDWGRPVFVWIHYIDPHGPYTPPTSLAESFVGDESFERDTRVIPLDYETPEGWPRNRVLGAVPDYQRIGDEDRVAWYVSQYDAEIRYMDRLFGEVIRFLRQNDLYRHSGILFASDHGESLGEHDYYFDHGWFVYDASLRVPLILKPPGQGQPRRIDAQVSNLDTLPTLLGLAGIPPPPDLPGRSLLGPVESVPLVIQNPPSFPERYVGVRAFGLKYIRDLRNGAEELYDLSADPGEEHDLMAAAPDRAEPLRDQLNGLREWVGNAEGPLEARELPPGERENLRRLGYTDE